ncbi:VOC family protein [Gaiella sp.]|uniref:VOC family protein n=1 Tax=Gaiella sp. TaxID=2663207 RepID=UPI0039C857AB
MTSVPGLLGVDHAGITVPSVPAAVEWFERVLGCSSPLAFGPFSDPTGTFIQDLLDVHPRAVVERIQHVRCGDGPSVELFQYSSPDQDRTFRRNSDYGGKHVAFYVRHIDKAVARMQALGAQKLLGPLAVTDGPAAGQSINYFRAPFGTYVELISYPKGMAYEASAAIPLWDPRDNRP